jgi:pyruvate ferredoxin oxidoreductase gamma subunit
LGWKILFRDKLIKIKVKIEKMEKKSYEIIIHGRGGQGAKTTAELLAQAGLTTDKFVQAFPEFGPERSGAPLRTFVRISSNFIRSHEPIISPDTVLILDEGLLSTSKVNKNIHLAKIIIINTSKSREKIQSVLSENEIFSREFKGEITTVDASGISTEIIGQDRPNTVILGKFAGMNNLVTVEDVVNVFRKKYTKKIGEELTEKNVEAIMTASVK